MYRAPLVGDRLQRLGQVLAFKGGRPQINDGAVQIFHHGIDLLHQLVNFSEGGSLGTEVTQLPETQLKAKRILPGLIVQVPSDAFALGPLRLMDPGVPIVGETDVDVVARR